MPIIRDKIAAAAMQKNMLEKLNVKIGDKVHVITLCDEWCIGHVTSISTGCDDYIYNDPIMWVTGICDEGEALFVENELELRGNEWWEKV